MAGIGLSGGFAAGAGADALEELLKRAFIEQSEKRRAAQEDQRIAQEGERLKMANADRDEARAIVRETQAQNRGLKLRGTLRKGQEIGPEQVGTLNEAGFGNEVVAPTLASRNIGQGLTSTPNPGRGTSFTGTPEQIEQAAQDEEMQRQIRIAPPALRGRLSMAALLPPDKRAGVISEVMREEAKPTSQPVMRVNPRTGKMEQIGDAPQGAHFVTEPAPPAQGGAGGGRSLTPTAEANLTTKLAADWQKVSAASREMDRQYNLMETGINRFRQGDKNGGSQAVLVTFQKILDPTSVVRESEYARSAQGVSMLQRMQGYAERLAAGGAGVPESALQEMVNTAKEFVTHSRKSAEGQRKRIAAFADKYNIPQELVFDDSVPSGQGTTPAAAPKRIRYDMNGNPIKD